MKVTASESQDFQETVSPLPDEALHRSLVKKTHKPPGFPPQVKQDTKEPDGSRVGAGWQLILIPFLLLIIFRVCISPLGCCNKVLQTEQPEEQKFTLVTSESHPTWRCGQGCSWPLSADCWQSQASSAGGSIADLCLRGRLALPSENVSVFSQLLLLKTSVTLDEGPSLIQMTQPSSSRLQWPHPK